MDPTGVFSNLSKHRIPIGRMGEKEELSNLAIYLLSDYANWITGQVIEMDGGEVKFSVNFKTNFFFLYTH